MVQRSGPVLLLAAAVIGGCLACGAIETDEVMAPRLPATVVGTSMEGENVTYGATVRPVLVEFCSKCHNPTSLTGGLDATTYQGLVEDTDVVVSGDADASLIVQYLEGGIMPPPGNPAPSDAQIASIRAWIAAGALDN